MNSPNSQLRLSDSALENALRAASRELPEGEMLLYLIVVTGDDGHAVINAASNISSVQTRINVVNAELESLIGRLPQ